MHILKTSKNPTGNSPHDLIAEALERGDFENLPNMGKPLRLDGYFSVKPEHQVSSQLLMDNKAIPQPLQDRKEIEELLRQVGKLLQDGTRELADLRQEIGLLGESLLAIYPDRDIAVAELGVTEWIAHFDTVRLEHSPDASSKSIVRACERIRRITKRYHRKTADILEQHLALITQADMLIARLNTGLMEGPVVGGSGNQMQRISVVERQENVAKDFEFIAPLPDGLQETILSFFRRIQPNPFRRFLAKIGRG